MILENRKKNVIIFKIRVMLADTFRAIVNKLFYFMKVLTQFYRKIEKIIKILIVFFLFSYKFFLKIVF